MIITLSLFSAETRAAGKCQGALEATPGSSEETIRFAFRVVSFEKFAQLTTVLGGQPAFAGQKVIVLQCRKGKTARELFARMQTRLQGQMLYADVPKPLAEQILGLLTRSEMAMGITVNSEVLQTVLLQIAKPLPTIEGERRPEPSPKRVKAEPSPDQETFAPLIFAMTEHPGVIPLQRPRIMNRMQSAASDPLSMIHQALTEIQSGTPREMLVLAKDIEVLKRTVKRHEFRDFVVVESSVENRVGLKLQVTQENLVHFFRVMAADSVLGLQVFREVPVVAPKADPKPAQSVVEPAAAEDWSKIFATLDREARIHRTMLAPLHAWMGRQYRSLAPNTYERSVLLANYEAIQAALIGGWGIGLSTWGTYHGLRGTLMAVRMERGKPVLIIESDGDTYIIPYEEAGSIRDHRAGLAHPEYWMVPADTFGN